MCDWDTEEYAEYLLWVEAARAKAPTARTALVRSEESAEAWSLGSASPVAAET